MKALVMYYSYSGSTKAIAEKTAKKEKAGLVELKEQKKRSVASAYIAGSFAAMRRKETALEHFTCDFGAYDKIIIAMPIWAGNPAPPFNTILRMLPENAKAQIELIMVSGSGSSKGSEEKTRELFRQKGLNVVKYLDVKSAKAKE